MNPVDTGRKLKVHKTFRSCPGRLLNVLCTFNLRSVSAGKFFLIYVNFSIWNLKIKLEKSEKLISVSVEYCIFRIILHICFLSCQKLCKESKSNYQKITG